VLLTAILSVFSLLVLGADFWQEKAYTQWSEKEAFKMLRDSPWADQVSVGDTMIGGRVPGGLSGSSAGGRGGGRRGGAAGGGDLAGSRDFTIRFQSATPIRMAMAQLALLNGSITPDQAEEWVRTPPADGYVVVAVSGGRWQALQAEDPESLKEKIYLEFRPSKRRIPVDRYLLQRQAEGPELYLLFSRADGEGETFGAGEEEIEFYVGLGSRLKFSKRFKLEKMMLNGKLEI
jgi:hypothetical protein